MDFGTQKLIDMALARPLDWKPAEKDAVILTGQEALQLAKETGFPLDYWMEFVI